MLTILKQRSQKKMLAFIEKQSSKKANIYYFGYGANIDPDFFSKRFNNFEVVGMAKLDDYKLIFNTPCEYAGKGFGGIEATPGGVVYGTLYKLNKESLSLLDCLEWVQFFFYYRKTETVQCKGQSFESEVYIPCSPRSGLVPPKGYQDLLIRGAQKMGFPEEYISYLKSFEPGSKFKLDHDFNLSDPRKKRALSGKYYKLHDRLREKLCNLI